MKIKNEVVTHETKFLLFKDIFYEDKNGVEKVWHKVSRVNQTNAVVIVAYKEFTASEGRKLVVTKEFRVPIADYEWGLPAGLIRKIKYEPEPH